MPMSLPSLEQELNPEQIATLTAFATSCRRSIISMLKNSQSGHPGGSLGCVDYLSLLYAFIISQTGEKVIVSNGHISPAVYSVLAELGYIPKEEVITGFRKIVYPYEGHVTRHVPGIWYGTGPLGTGISAASGFALSEKLKGSKEKVFALLGDGESQEGQVYEMMNFAAKYKLDNFIVFMDYNEVQLTDSLNAIMPVNPKQFFLAAGWQVFEVDGHDYAAMWRGLREAYAVNDRPILLLGHTIMGKGVEFMEKTGREHKADWHGKAPKPEQADEALQQLAISKEQIVMIDELKTLIRWRPEQPKFTSALSKVSIEVGEPTVYAADVLTDCRGAYGAALLDLAKRNPRIVALTADLADSVKTDGVKKKLPAQHVECGIAEQHMVSCAGGMSLDGFIPFASTFGAFMTSRAKDQARVNDINQANVKMVATHCGLSVGEDGPTHQAIDDSSSFMGFFNTMVMEPADPNQCDRMIRFVASHYGNFYVRMGRHKISVLTQEDGSVFFGADYQYLYGKCDRLRTGTDLTIVASGAVVCEALKALEMLKTSAPQLSVEIIIASSIKQFDDTLLESIQKTKRVLTVEDHNIYSGLGNQVARYLTDKKLSVEYFFVLGVDHYQLSGTAEALYDAAGISAKKIAEKIMQVMKNI